MTGGAVPNLSGSIRRGRASMAALATDQNVCEQDGGSVDERGCRLRDLGVGGLVLGGDQTGEQVGNDVIG